MDQLLALDMRTPGAEDSGYVLVMETRAWTLGVEDSGYASVMETGAYGYVRDGRYF